MIHECPNALDAIPELIIDFPLTEVKRLTGLDVPLPEARGVLERLGFFVAGQGNVVPLALGDDPTTKCSGNGLIMPSKVFNVVNPP